MSAITVKYSDINQYSPKETSLVINIDSILQSISNILGTKSQERLFNPEFGSSLESMLFEPMSDITVFNLFNSIISSVSKYEPRIDLNMFKSEIIPDFKNNIYDILLVFTLKNVDDQFFEYRGRLTNFTEKLERI